MIEIVGHVSVNCCQHEWSFSLARATDKSYFTHLVVGVDSISKPRNNASCNPLTEDQAREGPTQMTT